MKKKPRYEEDDGGRQTNITRKRNINSDTRRIKDIK